MEDGKVMNNLNVLYEDNHIIIVVKPYNILSQGDNTNDLSMVDLIKDYIKKKYNKPGNVYLGLVHRLDRPVSGIMVFARTSKAAGRLSSSFSNHEVVKKYLAIVHGRVYDDTLVDYIERGNDGKSFVSPKGKKAILEYKCLSYNKENDCSLVDITLKTGRHHQIRVQFSSRGHYLLGDQKYGVEDREQICLFSYYLEFVHPVTKEVLKCKYFPEKEGYWKLFNFDI